MPFAISSRFKLVVGLARKFKFTSFMRFKLRLVFALFSLLKLPRVASLKCASLWKFKSVFVERPRFKQFKWRALASGLPVPAL